MLVPCILFLFFLFLGVHLFLKNWIHSTVIESFCKVPPVNPVGTTNDLTYPIDPFPPQENIHTSSCGEYWKDWPSASNAVGIDEGPVVIPSDQIELPPDKQFGNNTYFWGLIDYAKLARLMSDDSLTGNSQNSPSKIFHDSDEPLIDPETRVPLSYSYEFNFRIIELNKKTWMNRWEEYNPMISVHFDYKEIESPIPEINHLNMQFLEKINTHQRTLQSNKDLLIYGVIPFEIYKYKIQTIRTFKKGKGGGKGKGGEPIYVIHLVLYRENDFFMPCFAYIGINREVTNIKYIGHYSKDSLLSTPPHDADEMTAEIINSNFSNVPVVNRDPDAIVALTKKHMEEYKIKNQYACFNLHYNSEDRKSEPILMYYNKNLCESSIDFFGRPKDVGIWDTPCKKDEECPYFKENKNYENTRGKCLESGYCELPLNMEPIGYHYTTARKPLCYNCNTSQFNIASTLDTCCDKQEHPDYSFENDFLERKNYFNAKFCSTGVGELDPTCSEFEL